MNANPSQIEYTFPHSLFTLPHASRLRCVRVLSEPQGEHGGACAAVGAAGRCTVHAVHALALRCDAEAAR